MNPGARQPTPPARSGLLLLTQFLSQVPPFASRPPFPKPRSPGGQEAAGPSRAQSSTVSSLSQQGSSWGCGPKGLSSCCLLPPHTLYRICPPAPSGLKVPAPTAGSPFSGGDSFEGLCCGKGSTRLLSIPTEKRAGPGGWCRGQRPLGAPSSHSSVPGFASWIP